MATGKIFITATTEFRSSKIKSGLNIKIYSQMSLQSKKMIFMRNIDTALQIGRKYVFLSADFLF